MIVAILDTNVLISGVLFSGAPRAVLQSAIAGHYEIATSEEIVAEFSGVLRRSRFGVSPEFVHTVVRELEALARLSYPPQRHSLGPDDPRDSMVIDCAVSSHSAYIVSGDKHLLALGTVLGIAVLQPAEFLKILP